MASKDAYCFLVPLTKMLDDRFFVGAVSVDGNEAVYNRLSHLFPTSNVKRVSDVIDFASKFDIEAEKIKKKTDLELEGDVQDKFENKKLWSLSEVEQWLEKDMGKNDDFGVDGPHDFSKDEGGKLAVNPLNNMAKENKHLKELTDKQEMELRKLKSDLDKKTKELFNSNTQIISLEKKIQDFESSKFNDIDKKLEDILNNQRKAQETEKSKNEERKLVQSEIQTNTGKLITNTEKIVEILGNRGKSKLNCRILAMQEIESSSKTITIFGSEEALQNLAINPGDLFKDLDLLKKSKVIELKLTDKSGIDNLIQLLENTCEKKSISEKSIAVIIMNIGEEVAQIVIDDEEFKITFIEQAKVALKRMDSLLKEKFSRGIIVLPPITPKSNGLIKKLATAIQQLKPEIDILNLSDVQKENAESCEEDQTWLIQNERYMKKFMLDGDDIKEGYNEYTSNVMITKLAMLVSEKKGSIDSCDECGLGHYRNSSCRSNSDNNNVKSAQSGGNRPEFSEECLRCFRSHRDKVKGCPVPQDSKCNFSGCDMTGHNKTVHFPRKNETVQRLQDEYGSDFTLIQPEIKRRRVNTLSSSTKKKLRIGEYDK